MNEQPVSHKKRIRAQLLALVKEGDPDTVAKISKETNDDVVRRAIAGSELTKPDTLKSLAIINSKTVRKRIVKNPNTPFKTLLMLENVGYEIDERILYEAALVELKGSLGEGSENIPEDWLIQMAKGLYSR